MKRLTKAFIVLGLIPLTAAFAQHGGGGPPPGRAPSGLHSGLPPVGPIPPLGGSRFPFGRHAGFGTPFFPAFPFWFGDSGYDYPAYQPAPSVVVVQQPPAYVVVPPAPVSEPVKPEVREYKNLPTASQPEGEPPAFTIVLKDGTVHFAVAVTAQDDTLHYVDPDGRHHSVPLAVIDRETTRRLNRERKLELQLPASDG